ncbi:Protein MIZU-KUSSEI 1 [Linum perenne]
MVLERSNTKIAPSSSSSLSPYSNYYTMTMLTRSTSSTSSSRPPPIPEHDIIIVPSRTSTSDHLLLAVRSPSPATKPHYKHFKLPSLVRTILKALSSPYTLLIPQTYQWLTSSSPRMTSAENSPASKQLIRTANTATHALGRKVTGTLYGYRRGHVTFAVQTDSRFEPVFIIELAVSTASLVKEMSSGLVRIALECEKSKSTAAGRKLFDEGVWSMYCNGRKCGYAAARGRCNEVDSRVLTTVRAVSVGAGVIPPLAELADGGESKTASFGGEMGELMYMRAKFERVVGSRDSEAFYMMNPDGNGGPELSLFLLRL